MVVDREKKKKLFEGKRGEILRHQAI